MRRLLQGITGTKTISEPLIIAVSAATKLFVGDIIETARTVLMTERKDSGAIRPGHIREAYRRLKLESKVPRRSFRRLFL
ncbi:transcription initiation factor TFIID subunit 11-like [Morus notabilis]|uniref:transcription initiation factor TFIID subunit 11-like n=1 Tax=Morus notabilis TaxID=981085 RepID=UPI000CED684F|nr:transcription initiation factor TFIID subunit 11-like [Morus notabilis]